MIILVVRTFNDIVDKCKSLVQEGIMAKSSVKREVKDKVVELPKESAPKKKVALTAVSTKKETVSKGQTVETVKSVLPKTKRADTVAKVVRMSPILLPTDEEIAERAYFIWEREGRQNGRDRENWLKAEAELMAERAKQ